MDWLNWRTIVASGRIALGTDELSNALTAHRLSTSSPGGLDGLGYHEGDDTLVERLMVGVDELDQHLVLPWQKAGDDERFAACIGPVPWQVVHSYVDVSDPRRHIERGRAEYLDDTQVLGAVLDDGATAGQPSRIWGIDEELCRGLFRRQGDDSRRAPKIPNSLGHGGQ